MDDAVKLPPKTRKPKQPLDRRVFMDGAIYLFRRADYVKATWSCRIKTPGVNGYTVKSTGTANEHEAYAYAHNLYLKNLGLVFTGRDIRSKYAKALLAEYVEYVLVHEPDSPTRKSKLSYLRRWQDFFYQVRIKDVDLAKLNELNAWTIAQSSRKTLAGNTVTRFIKYQKQFFKWCEQRGDIEKMPSFPTGTNSSNRRPDFDRSDYRKLTRAMQDFVKVKSPFVRRARIMLVSYVLILANTGIRVGEARKLKWRDVRQYQREGEDQPAICFLVSGKTGTREVVARTADVKEYLKRIIELRRAELGGKVPPSNDFIFCHPNGKAIHCFKNSFGALMRLANVEWDSHGEKHTLYSLRHTYATLRLQAGVPHLPLAQNMGTSVAMLEKHYAFHPISEKSLNILATVSTAEGWYFKRLLLQQADVHRLKSEDYIRSVVSCANFRSAARFPACQVR